MKTGSPTILAEFRAAKSICGRHPFSLSPDGAVSRHSEAAPRVLLDRPPLVPVALELKLRTRRDVRFQFFLHQDESDLLRQKMRLAEMTVADFVRFRVFGADYDPHLRMAFLQLNRELTVQGQQLKEIVKLLCNSAGANASMALIEALRGPLVETLRAIKAALIQNKAQP